MWYKLTDILERTTGLDIGCQLHFLSPLTVTPYTRVDITFVILNPNSVPIFIKHIFSGIMFGDLKSAAGVKALNEFLAEHSYIEG